MSALHSTKLTQRRLSRSESKEIAEAAAKGESVTTLAARFGVSRPTIYRALERHAVRGDAETRSSQNPRISIRLEPHEIAALDVLCGRLNLNRSELSRHVLRKASDYLEPESELIQAIRDLTKEIKSIGGNLNQIAHHLNRDARFHGRASLSEAQWKQVEENERDLKALARSLDALFVNDVRRRRARNADILKRFGE